jgi:hypothetical protein
MSEKMFLNERSILHCGYDANKHNGILTSNNPVYTTSRTIQFTNERYYTVPK